LWGVMAGLLRYVAVRLALAVPTLLILLTVVFFVLRVIPGNPIVAMVGMKAPQEYVEQLIKEAGLDKPLYVQYFDYLAQVFTGNLGRSLIFGRREWRRRFWIGCRPRWSSPWRRF